MIGKGKAGPGRPKGVPNKATAAIKDMIVQALDKACELKSGLACTRLVGGQ